MNNKKRKITKIRLNSNRTIQSSGDTLNLSGTTYLKDIGKIIGIDNGNENVVIDNKEISTKNIKYDNNQYNTQGLEGQAGFLWDINNGGSARIILNLGSVEEEILIPNPINVKDNGKYLLKIIKDNNDTVRSFMFDDNYKKVSKKYILSKPNETRYFEFKESDGLLYQTNVSVGDNVIDDKLSITKDEYIDSKKDLFKNFFLRDFNFINEITNINNIIDGGFNNTFTYTEIHGNTLDNYLYEYNKLIEFIKDRYVGDWESDWFFDEDETSGIWWDKTYSSKTDTGIYFLITIDEVEYILMFQGIFRDGSDWKIYGILFDREGNWINNLTLDTDGKGNPIPVSGIVFNKSRLKYLPIPIDDGDAVNKKFLIDSISQIDITYNDLFDKITGNSLTIGTYYKITDYQTVHYILEGNDVFEDGGNKVINSGSSEPLIVKAITNDKLDIRAYSEDYPQDIIHYDWNPENWKYDLGFAGFDEAVLDGFKGVIYFRHDTKNDNSMGYDFRNVKFRRWFATGYTDTSIWINSYQGLTSTSDGVIDSTDFIDVLTFNCPDAGQYETEVFSNHFKLIRDSTDKWYELPSILQNNVFHLKGNYGWFQVYGNSFGEFCYTNTINGYQENNNYLDFCHENIIGNNSRDNNIGSWFNNNRTRNYFRYNTIGNNFRNNIIGHFSQYNTIGNYFFNNTIGYFFQNNTIGNYFLNNTIGNYFQFNTNGNNFRNNIIGGTFQYNTIGNFFQYNTIGSNFRNNTIGNFFTHNTIGNYFYWNTINNNFRYIQTSDGSSTEATAFKNNTIKDSVQGASGTPLVLDQDEYYEYHNTETYRKPDDSNIMVFYDDDNDRVIKDPKKD